jgi:sugar phosphate isomerase/epimerase
MQPERPHDMIHLLLNTISLEPNRWTADKIPHHKLDSLLEPIANSGFRFIEIWQYHISRESQINIEIIHQTANSLGLSFPIVGMYPKLHLEDQARRVEMDCAKRLFEYAKILGGKIIKIFVGNRQSVKITSREYETSVEFMKVLTGVARTFNLTIAGETHENTLFDNIDACARFMQDVDVENFKICFQPYDFRNTQKAIDAYGALSEDVIHVHLQGRKDEDINLLENSDLDYEKLIQAIAEKAFDGYISIEFVKDCVVKKPADLDLNLVLRNAQRDRDFVMALIEKGGILCIA